MNLKRNIKLILLLLPFYLILFLIKSAISLSKDEFKIMLYTSIKYFIFLSAKDIQAALMRSCAIIIYEILRILKQYPNKYQKTKQ